MHKQRVQSISKISNMSHITNLTNTGGTHTKISLQDRKIKIPIRAKKPDQINELDQLKTSNQINALNQIKISNQINASNLAQKTKPQISLITQELKIPYAINPSPALMGEIKTELFKEFDRGKLIFDRGIILSRYGEKVSGSYMKTLKLPFPYDDVRIIYFSKKFIDEDRRFFHKNFIISLFNAFSRIYSYEERRIVLFVCQSMSQSDDIELVKTEFDVREDNWVYDSDDD